MGQDSADCGTNERHACLTLHHVINMTQSGDVILLKADQSQSSIFDACALSPIPHSLTLRGVGKAVLQCKNPETSQVWEIKGELCFDNIGFTSMTLLIHDSALTLKECTFVDSVVLASSNQLSNHQGKSSHHGNDCDNVLLHMENATIASGSHVMRNGRETRNAIDLRCNNVQVTFRQSEFTNAGVHIEAPETLVFHMDSTVIRGYGEGNRNLTGLRLLTHTPPQISISNCSFLNLMTSDVFQAFLLAQEHVTAVYIAVVGCRPTSPNTTVSGYHPTPPNMAANDNYATPLNTKVNGCQPAPPNMSLDGCRPIPPNPSINIDSTLFSNNHGALTFRVHPDCPIRAHVSNCSFLGNRILSDGAAVHVGADRATLFLLNVTDSEFINNTAGDTDILEEVSWQVCSGRHTHTHTHTPTA